MGFGHHHSSLSITGYQQFFTGPRVPVHAALSAA
jgi:hypothetical protein